MDTQLWSQDAAVTRTHHRAPPRRRFLAITVVLLTALMLAAWPVPTADAARIICVWDPEQKKWVCEVAEGAVGA